MEDQRNLIIDYCRQKDVELVAVTKNRTISEILQLYQLGFRNFGENRIQELVQKRAHLPEDIKWHQIGHIQKNKLKHIISFVHLIHSVDSYSLLEKIQDQAQKLDRKIDILLQVKIAVEDTKYGFLPSEIPKVFEWLLADKCPNILVKGLMGMASFSNDEKVVRSEFRNLSMLMNQCKDNYPQFSLTTLSMGMSSDYKIAIQENSTLVRIGTALFQSDFKK